MAFNDLLKKANPILIVKEITDFYVRKNFQTLQTYFATENQFLGFKFFEIVFNEAVTNAKIAHGLTTTPKDIVVTKIIGSGTVRFNHGKFTAKEMDISTTGSAKIRFYVGTYWNYETKEEDPADAFTDYRAESLVKEVVSTSTVSAMPSGIILPFGGSAAPSGYLFCDGAEISRTKYPDLFSAIGTAFGVGDGLTTFNAPDFRGRFLRGVDGGVGRDPDRAARTAMNTGGNTGDNIGSVQTDELKSHNHILLTGRGSFSVAGGFFTLYPENNPDNSKIVNAGGNETRPINAYVNYIIKT